MVRQYWSSDATQGGAFEVSDYCPFVQEYSNSICTDSATGLVTPRQDVFGTTSKCFASTLLSTGASSTSYMAFGCYSVCRCTSAATVYADALVLPVLHILGCMAVLQFVKFNVDM